MFQQVQVLPSTGRLLTVDPIFGHVWNPQSFNKYLYTLGDPINAVDPTGQDGNEISLMAGMTNGQIIAGLSVIGGLIGLGMATYTGQLQRAVNEISWMLQSTRLAVEEAGAALMTRITDTAKALDDAVVRVLEGAGELLENLRRLPVFFVIRSLGEHIYNNDIVALAQHPDWFILNYMADPVQTAAHRRDALARGWILLNPALGLNSLDEYPYASTTEGGDLARVAVHEAERRT
jgi:hypothetical protein